MVVAGLWAARSKDRDGSAAPAPAPGGTRGRGGGGGAAHKKRDKPGDVHQQRGKNGAPGGVGGWGLGGGGGGTGGHLANPPPTSMSACAGKGGGSAEGVPYVPCRGEGRGGVGVDPKICGSELSPRRADHFDIPVCGGGGGGVVEERLLRSVSGAIGTNTRSYTKP